MNAARKVRATLAREQEEQGEDIILSRRELKALDPFFDDLRIDSMNLLAMGKRVLRGKFEKRWARTFVGISESIDSAVLSLVPALHNWCGEAVITARRR